jgi:hypothetical protein
LKLMLYRPGRREGTSYRPLPLVVVAVDTPVWTLVSVTATLGTTAPEGSVTIPLISPVFVFCACPGCVSSRTAATAIRTHCLHRCACIAVPPEFTPVAPSQDLSCTAFRPVSSGADQRADARCLWSRKKCMRVHERRESDESRTRLKIFGAGGTGSGNRHHA